MRFELDNFDFLNKLGDKFELSDLGQPIQHAWVPIKGKFFPKVAARTLPDITTCEADMLLLNPKAYDCLNETLSSYGELLPVEIGDDTYYLFNLLTRLEDSVIDTENSEYEYFEEEPVGFRVLNFNENNVPQDKILFGVEGGLAYNLYCDDRFKNILEENDLNGLFFNTTLIDPYFK